jgi:membrane protease YdiL (CAAX protease family)
MPRVTGAREPVENQRDEQGGEARPAGGLFRGPPAYKARTPWRPAAGLAAAVGIVGLGILGAILLLPSLDGGQSQMRLPGPGRGASEAALRVFAIWQVLVVLLTLIASSLLGGRPRDVLALRPAPRGWRTYAVAILTLAGLQIVLAIVQHNLMGHDLMTDLRPFLKLVRGPDWLLTAAVVGIGAPLSEELLFRGFLLSALARTSLGFWGAAVIATALWTALHGYSSVGIAEVFIIGLFFSWLLWRTGSLWVAIFCHALYNSLIVLVLRFVELPTPA